MVAWGADSIKDLSKAVDALLKEIAKKNPKDDKKFTVKTAVADGQQVSLDMAMKMPTRLEAIGEIIGMILGPASEIAAALTGPAQQVASQIATIADKKEETRRSGRKGIDRLPRPLEAEVDYRSYYASRMLQRHFR